MRALARFFDVRPGEGRLAAQAFVLLLLIIAAHTMLETARDALLLAALSPRALGLVYVSVAALSFPAGALSFALGARLGPRRALAATLGFAAVVCALLYAVPAGVARAFALYVVTGLFGAVLVPQFWGLAARLFTIAEGRRLLGLVSSAGVLGGVIGSSAAALVLMAMPVKLLLVAAAAIFVIAGALVAVASPLDQPSRSPALQPPSTLGRFGAFSDEPFLWRIAILVVLSTATVLTVDYLFKWTVAQHVPAAQLGRFFARYYAALNVASLVVQLFVGGALVRRLGVTAAVSVTPVLLLFGGVGALLAGGAVLAVLLVKGLDGSLRHSIQRITTELVYLPVPARARERAKPFIDGTLARVAQGLTAGALLALGATGHLSQLVLAAIVVGLAVLWLASAVTLRAPYLALFRRALSAGSLDASASPVELDLTSAAVLVEHLASPDPSEVIAAMNVLVWRKRDRLIPALVLYHTDERVLVRALAILSESGRADFLRLAEPLLSHPSQAVRNAALRALALAGKLDVLERAAGDASARVRGYAVVHLASRAGLTTLVDHPGVAAAAFADGPARDDGRLGVLAAIADLPPTAPLAELLLALAGDERMSSPEAVELLARAAIAQRDPRLVPTLLARLRAGAGREAIREALVALGDPAFDAVWDALGDRRLDRRVRIHLPRTLSRFGTQRAAGRLLEIMETEPDGLVRYKALRGLGQLVARDRKVRVPRARIERLSQANLVEHLRILGLRIALDAPRAPEGGVEAHRPQAIRRVLGGLLDDKLGQSLERAFRLLKIALPREDLHRVQQAALSSDRHARANAGEFLDALLIRRDQQRLRALLRLVTEDLSAADRVARAAGYLPLAAPRAHRDAVMALVEDNDVTVAGLAATYAASLDDAKLREAAELARRRRPEVDARAHELFDVAAAKEAGGG